MKYTEERKGRDDCPTAVALSAGFESIGQQETSPWDLSGNSVAIRLCL